MYRIGIDVGSTYTKYCILNDDNIEQLYMEKTPIRQKEYFADKVSELCSIYSNPLIISCGYGKKNVSGIGEINELTALAKGCFYHNKKDGIILDIGGQDTKIIMQEKGRLKAFFVNDKCAAGSGMFLSSTLDMIGVAFEEIKLLKRKEKAISLSSICAVFAQSEIVELIADNKSEDEIVQAVIEQILLKAKPLLQKIKEGPIFLAGGLSQISGMGSLASDIFSRPCEVLNDGTYLASIGCAIG